MTDDEAKRLAQEIDSRAIRLQPLLSALPPRQRALEIARFLLGTGAIFEPLCKNDGVPRFLFMDGEWDEVNNRGLAWCAGFVVYCYATALHAIQGNKYMLRSCAHIADRAKENDCWRSASIVPDCGDIILLWGRRGSDRPELALDTNAIRHCGIVESVDGDQVHSIEGNWGNKLSNVSRALTDSAIAGYAKF